MDVIVVWHPDDRLGPLVGEALVDHFHGTVFSGLIDGAVEVAADVAWWAPHAPEPVTLAAWLDKHPAEITRTQPASMLVLHPGQRQR
jgi:hypothetical protein